MLASNLALPKRVMKNAEYFRTRMLNSGFRVLGKNHPVCPIFVGDEKTAIKFADEMIGK